MTRLCSDFLILPVENGCVAVRISSYLFRSSLDSFLSQISGVLKINTSFSSAFGDIDDKLSSFLASMTKKMICFILVFYRLFSIKSLVLYLLKFLL